VTYTAGAKSWHRHCSRHSGRNTTGTIVRRSDPWLRRKLHHRFSQRRPSSRRTKGRPLMILPALEFAAITVVLGVLALFGIWGLSRPDNYLSGSTRTAVSKPRSLSGKITPQGRRLATPVRKSSKTRRGISHPERKRRVTAMPYALLAPVLDDPRRGQVADPALEQTRA
jgi:hypothetical protein